MFGGEEAVSGGILVHRASIDKLGDLERIEHDLLIAVEVEQHGHRDDAAPLARPRSQLELPEDGKVLIRRNLLDVMVHERPLRLESVRRDRRNSCKARW